MVVRNPLSARKFLEKGFYRFERRAVPAGIVLLIGDAGSFFHECLDLRGVRRQRHMKVPAALIENAGKSLSFGVVLKIIFGSHGKHFIGLFR